MSLNETSYVLETTLNVPASDMIQSVDDVVMRHLTKRYVGYCERQCLVVSVKGIIQRSSVRMTKARLDGSGDISVRFEVLGNVLRPRDLLVGCVVKNITGNNVTCVHPKVTLTIDMPSLARHVQVGNSLTAEVTESSYPQGSETITASGIFYHNSPKPVLYGTQYPAEAPRTPELQQILQRTLSRLSEARRNFHAAPAARRDYFQAMYYSYDAPMSEGALPKGVTAVRTSDIAMELLGHGKTKLHAYKGTEQLLLLSHSLLDASLGTILHADPEVVVPDPLNGPEVFEFTTPGLRPVYVQMNLIQLLCQLLDQECRYLNVITEMAHYYTDEANFKRNDRIWDKLNQRRRPQLVRTGKK